MSPTPSGGPDPAATDVIEPGQAPQTGDQAADLAAAGGSAELMANSIGDYALIWWRRVRNGESGALPIILGLIAIVIFFQVKNDHFLTAGNLVNLMIQSVPFIMLGMAEIFVLLLGEIDLSVGSLSGLAGATFAVLSVTHGMNEWLAFVLAILTGTVAGAVQGFVFARIGVPAFAVTLAGLLFVIDGVFFTLTLAQRTYFQKIADAADMAATASVAFTINHVAAVAVPVAFGALGMIDPAIIFWLGACVASVSLTCSFLVPRHPAPGHESVLVGGKALPAE